MRGFERLLAKLPTMTADHPKQASASQEAAVVGVVVAGVLAAFVVPGPYDWGSMLIGLLLAGLLVAYADLNPESWRSALGTAAAGAFALIFVFGHWLDKRVVTDDSTGLKIRWLSGWPVPSQTVDETAPDPGGGEHVLLLWTGLAVLLFVILQVASWVAKRRAVDASQPKR